MCFGDHAYEEQPRDRAYMNGGRKISWRSIKYHGNANRHGSFSSNIPPSRVVSRDQARSSLSEATEATEASEESKQETTVPARAHENRDT